MQGGGMSLFIPLLVLLFVSFPSYSQAAGQTAAPLAHVNGSAGTLCWTADGSEFAVAETDCVRIRNASNGAVISSIPVKSAKSLGFASEGDADKLMLVVRAEDGSLSAWNLDGDAPVPAASSMTLDVKQRYTCAAFSANSNFVAAGMTDGTVRVFFKLRYAKEFLTRDSKEQTGRIAALAFSPDSKYLVSVSEDNTAVIYDAAFGSVKAHLPVSGSGVRVPCSFAFGGTLALATGSRIVSLYSSSGKVLGSVDTERDIHALHLLSDARTLAVQTEDGVLDFYNLNTGKLTGVIPPCSDSALQSVVFSSDGSELLQGYADGSVYKLPVALSLQKPVVKPVAKPVPQPAPQPEEKPEPPVQKTAPQPAAQVEPTRQERASEPEPQVQKTEPLPAIPSEPIVQERAPEPEVQELPEAKPAKEDTSPFVYKDLLVLYAGGSLLRDPFDAAATVGAVWKVRNLKPPFYFGAGLEGQVGKAFKTEKFPHTYTWKGESLDPPMTGAFSVYAPLGVSFTLGSALQVYTEVHLGAREVFLWQKTNDGIIRSDMHLTFLAGLHAGVMFHGFIVQLGVDYDKVQEFVPGIFIGYSLQVPSLGGKK